MAKFNFFDMFKRKDKSDASNGSEKKQKTIEEMTFDELYSAYNDCKIKELMSDNMQIGNEDKQKIEARLEQITARMISLIRQKDSQAVAFVNKLISRYSSNHETLKKLKSIKRDLQKVRDRISELEVKELLDEELTSTEVEELKNLKSQQKVIEQKYEEVSMQINSLEYENADKMVLILTLEIESPELDRIQKEEDAEAEAEMLKFLKENGIDMGDGSSGASNGDGGIQPGE